LRSSQSDGAVFGLPGIGTVPRNVHVCHFYRKRQDLVDTLVPFFEAGLSNGERCLWITADPLLKVEAATELAKALPVLNEVVQAGQLLIQDAEEWCSQLKEDFAKEMLARLMSEETRARADGYRGFRLAANASVFASRDWRAFIEFENALNDAVRNRRLIALCSYNLLDRKATDVFQATRLHHHTLARSRTGWELI
jgi:hypothetical protein